MNNEYNTSKEPEVNYKQHWDNAYKKTELEKLGWYESRSEKTFDIINELPLSKDAKQLHVGVGSSTLVDELLEEGYTNIMANDLSIVSLNSLQDRLGSKSDNIEFIQDDITQPKKLHLLKDISLWNDRAVLHFFTEKEDQKAYFNLLKSVVVSQGFVIIAVFAEHGAEKCCGLALQRYNVEMLKESLGEEFMLLQSFDHTFINPFGGERPYIYTLFQRK